MISTCRKQWHTLTATALPWPPGVFDIAGRDFNVFNAADRDFARRTDVADPPRGRRRALLAFPPQRSRRAAVAFQHEHVLRLFVTGPVGLGTERALSGDCPSIRTLPVARNWTGPIGRLSASFGRWRGSSGNRILVDSQLVATERHRLRRQRLGATRIQFLLPGIHRAVDGADLFKKRQFAGVQIAGQPAAKIDAQESAACCRP